MAHPGPFVSRAGLKLEHALNEFGLDVTGFICADFGCNVGGFTDCLLQRGAARVYAIDTAYGVLDYRLRTEPRVVVMERTNALHAQPPSSPEVEKGSGVVFEGKKGSGVISSSPEMTPDPFSLVVIDLGWTPQRLAIPAALRWLKSTSTTTPDPTPTPAGGGTLPCIITLIKPHYELSEDEKRTLLIDGHLDPAEAGRIFHRVLEEMPRLGVTVQAATRSPITGGKSSRRGEGNIEFLALLTPSSSPPPPEGDG